MTARVPSPLVGFNNDFRYRGMSFHIQTEDSGVGRPHIITHLFADGGRVIKTMRVNYSEHVNSPDCRKVVQRMMRDQHRAMAYDLRNGRVDAIIDELIPRQTPLATREGARSCPAPGDAEEGSKTHEPMATLSAEAKQMLPADAASRATTANDDEALPQPGSGAPCATASRVPPLSAVFAALPPDSLDAIILRYVAGRW